MGTLFQQAHETCSHRRVRANCPKCTGEVREADDERQGRKRPEGKRRGPRPVTAQFERAGRKARER
jgi:hypothetical protein